MLFSVVSLALSAMWIQSIIMMVVFGMLQGALSADPMNDYLEEYQNEVSSSLPATLSYHNEDGHTWQGDEKDVEQYMPYAEHRPKGQSVEESKEQCFDRVSNGKKRFDAKRAKMKTYLEFVARRNQDPSKLGEEMREAVRAYKNELKLKGQMYRKHLEDVRSSPVSVESSSTNDAEEAEREKQYRRKRQTEASVWRRMYRNSSESEKVAVAWQAEQAGFSLDDLTRPKFTPPIWARHQEKSTAAIDNDCEKEGGNIDISAQEDDAAILPTDDPNYIPPDWLSLRL